MSAPSDPRVVFNPEPARFGKLDGRPIIEFHRKLPGYRVTPLIAAPRIAARLGVRQVWVKDESNRIGLPAYKILGASWATFRALEARVGTFAPWQTVEELARQMQSRPRVELVAATEGNHGRAVARMAKWLGLSCQIFMPRDAIAERVRRIELEGANVTLVDGTYDDAVRTAAAAGNDRRLVISDTGWEGYEAIPNWVVDGYETLFAEIDERLRQAGESGPGGVAVQMGVGALASAVVKHYRQPGFGTAVIGVEPVQAACILESIQAGHRVTIPGPFDPATDGLNCGTPSSTAWPSVSTGLTACVAIATSRAQEAAQALAAEGVSSSPSGAAGLGGLLELLTSDRAVESRRKLNWNSTSSLLVISTEGAVGERPAAPPLL